MSKILDFLDNRDSVYEEECRPATYRESWGNMVKYPISRPDSSSDSSDEAPPKKPLKKYDPP